MALRRPSVRVVFLFPDSNELRDMRAPPRLGRHVRSPKGALWKVAEVLTSGRDTYTVTVVAPSLTAKVPQLAADHLRHAVRRRTPDRDTRDLAADLLQRAQRAKDSISPRAIRRRRRERNYFP